MNLQTTNRKQRRQAKQAARKKGRRRPESGKQTIIHPLLEAASQCNLAGRHSEAEAHCRQVLAEAGEDLNARKMLSATLLLSGKFDEARAICKEGTRLYPQEIAFVTNLGIAHKNLQDFDAAVHWLRQSVAKSPNNVNSLTNLAATLQALPKTRLDGLSPTERTKAETVKS